MITECFSKCIMLSISMNRASGGLCKRQVCNVPQRSHCHCLKWPNEPLQRREVLCQQFESIHLHVTITRMVTFVRTLSPSEAFQPLHKRTLRNLLKEVFQCKRTMRIYTLVCRELYLLRNHETQERHGSQKTPLVKP